MHMAAVMGDDHVVSRLAHYAASLGNAYGYWTASNWWNNHALAGAPVPK
jgi:hypothetical protein